MTYLLGRSVIAQIPLKRERWPGGYHVRGISLVYPGQEVLPDQPVIRIEKVGSADSTRTPSLSPLPPISKTPSTVDYGLARDRASMNSRQVGETIPAGMYGRVVGITHRGGVVIEARAALVQGTIGAGNQVAGVLTIWQMSPASQVQQVIPPGALLVIPGPLNFAMLRQAMISGVSGIIASSIPSRDFEGFLRTDLVELLSNDDVDLDLMQSQLPLITLMLTEGLGTIAMPARTTNLLSQFQGSIALLSGVTSARLGICPELVISFPSSDAQPRHLEEPETTLTPSMEVRVCSGEYEGAIGKVDYLFKHQQTFASGVQAPAVRLHLEDGSFIVVPNVLIECVG